MKIIAFYLPQFHQIPENDEWWGEGFTEWRNVRNAKPLFEGHHQPKVPMDQNYYDLSDVSNMYWQAKLAKEHGIYGFCFYHYWFNGHLLLEKPVENYLKEPIDFPFCLCWPNEHWTNAWVSGQNKVLIEQKYGGEREWRQHFDYLLPFFRDKRYIQIDNRPVFIIYRPELISRRAEMLKLWNEWAIQEGFSGLHFMLQRPDVLINNPKEDMSMFDNVIEYQPYTTFLTQNRSDFNVLRRIKNNVATFLEKKFKISASDINRFIKGKQNGPRIYDYETIWQYILDSHPLRNNSIPCAFVNWDNTPRRGVNGSVIQGMTAEKFNRFFKELILKAKNEFKSEYMFIFAWNEWAEGGYLEPDEENGYGYLEAIKSALIETGEFQ